MDLWRDTSTGHAQSRHSDCSAAAFLSRINGIAWLVSVLAAMVAFMGVSISKAHASPIISSEDDPSQALSSSQETALSAGDGYASTSFTPPWSATDALTIFASSTTHTGNLGGLEGARVICQNLANAQQALQGTTWYPLLSDSTWDASSLTGKSSLPSPIYRIDGTVLASSRAALWSGSGLNAAILKTETGLIRYDAVYTGTNSTGGKGSFHCSNWSSTSGNGLLGATTETSNSWITGPLTGCGVPYRIYCIGNYNPFGVNPTITPTPVSSNTPTATPTPTFTFTPTTTATPASSFTPTMTPTATALSTSTPTPTPAPGTPTPTPAVSTLSFRVVIASTPVPSLPVSVGGSIFNTDSNGVLSTTASSSSSVTVQTGLPAVAFTPFTDIANRFNGRTVEIEATRLINPLPNICSVLVGNQLNVFFPYENTSGVALSVPLSLYRLNRILSPSGVAAPANLFAPGLQGNGFTLPISHFQAGNTVSGTWEFLATSVTVPSTLTTCSAQGNPNPTPSPTPAAPPSCTAFDFAVIFIEAKRTVTNLSEESLKAAARKEWNPTGNLRDPFLNSGALALNKLIAIIQRTGRTLYTCSSPPPTSSCTEKTISKSEITNAFNLIFPKTLPSGLTRVKRRIPIEKNRYANILAKIPTKAYSCR